jgi:hypothetical protein
MRTAGSTERRVMSYKVKCASRGSGSTGVRGGPTTRRDRDSTLLAALREWGGAEEGRSWVEIW